MDNKDKQEEELDLADILRNLWNKRRFIAIVSGVCLLCGVIMAVSQRDEYTASSVILPQISSSAAGGSRIATMLGQSVADVGEVILPQTYSLVVSSVPFQKELMRSMISVEGVGQQVMIRDYLTDGKYGRFSLLSAIKRYTIGLPGMMIGKIRNVVSSGGVSVPAADTTGYEIEKLSPVDAVAMGGLLGRVKVAVDDRQNNVIISATMPEPLMAAQIAIRTQELLQEYITRFKLQKAEANLEFIENRYTEAKTDFENKQRALAKFQDTNLDISSAVARTREIALTNESNLAFTIYSDLARQRELAIVKIKEDSPVFAIVKPVTVPLGKSGPNRGRIVAIGLLIGLVAGIGLVVGLSWLAGAFDVKALEKWRTES